MRKSYIIVLLGSHIAIALFGFALGLYTLPILIAPEAPSTSEIDRLIEQEAELYTAKFTPDLQGSDRLHWGDGDLSIGRDYIAFVGKLAPGPDYKLYLTSQFVETEPAFLKLKPSALYIGDVDSFENFIISIPPNADLSKYNTLVIWCETFNEFITAAQYRE